MLNFDDYKMTLPYPNKNNFTFIVFSRIKDGEVETKVMRSKDVTPFDFNETFSSWEKQILVDTDSLQKAKNNYIKIEASLLEKFKKDLLSDLGITDNPKAERLFNKAWEDGHASGYSTIYDCALELVPLIT